MGLAERRAGKAFQESAWPKLHQEILAAATYDLPIEVQWEELLSEGYASSYEEFWTKVYFRPLIDALQSITRDEMGKQALKSGLTKVIVRNQGGFYSTSQCFSWEAGVLTFDHRPDSNVDDIKDRTEVLVKLLESKL